MNNEKFSYLPIGIFGKWQEICNLIASLLHIPSALILKAHNEYFEVVVSAQSEDNIYRPGDKIFCSELFEQIDINLKTYLKEHNALEAALRNKMPENEHGWLAYFGLTLNYPDGNPYGCICILDNKKNYFPDESELLLKQFKRLFELDLLGNMHIAQAEISDKDGILRNSDTELVETNTQLHDDNQENLKLWIEKSPLCYLYSNRLAICFCK